MVKKRSLFDTGKLAEELEEAVLANDVVKRVKLENRVRLNKSTESGDGLDEYTLQVVQSELKKFNKDRRSYGINTGIEIAVDIISELRFRREK